MPLARRRLLVLAALVAIATLGAYFALLFAPGPLFRYAYAATNVTVHSDRPLGPEIAGVAARVEVKIQRSPLFDAARRHDVYLCNGRLLWWLLSSGNRRAAAITVLAALGGPVITREAHVARDRLVQASGEEAPGERTLDYYLSHEITHRMTAAFLGPRAYVDLPVWVREGYADYVGRGDDFDYDDARAALLGLARSRSPPQAGFYLRDALLVAHLLDRERWTVSDLLRSPPDQRAVEERVRAGRIDLRHRDAAR